MFVYFIINEVNLKLYIGKSNNPKSRWSRHRVDSRDSAQVLYRAMRKYGKDKFHFELLGAYQSDPEALRAEAYWIKEYDSTIEGWGYNMTSGGESPIFAEEVKAKHREYMQSPARRQKQREILISRMSNSEARKQVSEGLKLYFEDPVARQKNRDAQIICQNNPEVAAKKALKTKFYSSDAYRTMTEKAVNLYSEGLNFSEISRIINLDPKCVKTRLIKAGITLRPTKASK